MGIASILGSYVYKALYSDLPQDVIAIAKDRILDFLETGFYSYRRRSMEPIIQVLKTYDAREESTVIGEGVKLPCGFAAMLNSSFSNISDGYRFAGAHPSCIIIPAALAVSETKCSTKTVSGKELMLAIVLGYEVMLRIGQAMYPFAVKRGFCPTTICGTIGAAAAVSKILGLDEESTINALSIASLMGPGLEAAAAAPNPLLSFQFGKTSEAGVLSTLVAQAGLKGSDDILEEGFFPAYTDKYHLDVIDKDLGQDYAIAKTYLKLHGGCRHIHASIDAALHIVNKHGLKPDDVEKIRVKTYGTLFALSTKTPKTGYQAEFSIVFGVAAALTYGEVSIDRFTDSNLWDERVQQLMRKTIVEHDPELDRECPKKRPSMVEVTTKDGEVFSHSVDLAKGEPENPLSKSEIEDKFNHIASKAVNEEARRKIIDFVNRLETTEDITELFPLLKATSRA